MELCAACGKKGVKVCGGCRLVRYCGEKHAMKDWKRHKRVCSRFPLFFKEFNDSYGHLFNERQKNHKYFIEALALMFYEPKYHQKHLGVDIAELSFVDDVVTGSGSTSDKEFLFQHLRIILMRNPKSTPSIPHTIRRNRLFWNMAESKISSYKKITENQVELISSLQKEIEGRIKQLKHLRELRTRESELCEVMEKACNAYNIQADPNHSLNHQKKRKTLHNFKKSKRLKRFRKKKKNIRLNFEICDENERLKEVNRKLHEKNVGLKDSLRILRITFKDLSSLSFQKIESHHQSELKKVTSSLDHLEKRHSKLSKTIMGSKFQQKLQSLLKENKALKNSIILLHEKEIKVKDEKISTLEKNLGVLEKEFKSQNQAVQQLTRKLITSEEKKRSFEFECTKLRKEVVKLRSKIKECSEKAKIREIQLSSSYKNEKQKQNVKFEKLRKNLTENISKRNEKIIKLERQIKKLAVKKEQGFNTKTIRFLGSDIDGKLSKIDNIEKLEEMKTKNERTFNNAQREFLKSVGNIQGRIMVIQSRFCSVCFERVADTSLICGHLWCSECSEKFQNCPLCRRKNVFNKRRKVFRT